jgi:hypothetical protein
LGVNGSVSSAGAGADTIGVIRGAEVGMVTIKEIGRAGLTVRVFGRFKVRVKSFGKS